MDFGSWVRSLRQAQKFDIRALAERAEVEVSTISRVENARSKVTLLTSIRLCRGLGATFDDLLGVVYGKRAVRGNRERQAQASAVLTSDEVDQFLQYIHREEKEGKAWFSGLITKVISASEGAGKRSGEDGSELSVPVDFLLIDSPFYRFEEVQYPPTLSAKDIVTLYECGGLLTPLDIGEYIRKVRRERKVTLEQLERAAKFSTSVLLRLESPVIEQIKLADVVLLDQHLDQNGVLFSMYWDTYSFYEDLVHRYPANAERDMRLVSIFVLTCRWLQAMDPQDVSWLDGVRAYEKLV